MVVPVIAEQVIDGIAGAHWGPMAVLGGGAWLRSHLSTSFHSSADPWFASRRGQQPAQNLTGLMLSTIAGVAAALAAPQAAQPALDALLSLHSPRELPLRSTACPRRPFAQTPCAHNQKHGPHSQPSTSAQPRPQFDALPPSPHVPALPPPDPKPHSRLTLRASACLCAPTSTCRSTSRPWPSPMTPASGGTAPGLRAHAAAAHMVLRSAARGLGARDGAPLSQSAPVGSNLLAISMRARSSFHATTPTA
jgi:hypothetical protein